MSKVDMRCPTGGWLPLRHQIVIASFFGFCLIMVDRVDMGVAMVAMVNSSFNETDGASEGHVGEFDWSESVQGLILSSFFMSFAPSCFFGGYLSEKFGAKLIFGGSIFVLSIVTLLTPPAARHSVSALILVRVIGGVANGLSFPALNTVISRWIPRNERSMAFSISLSGSRTGNLLGLLLTGVLSKVENIGWPLPFYIFGAAGILWFAVWMYIMYETPLEHPRISKQELQFILDGQGEETANKKAKVPWKSLLTSAPVWAVMLANVAETWGLITVPTILPLYFANMLGYDVRETGIYTSMPYLVQAVIMLVSGFAADELIRRGLGRTTVRKVFTGLSFYAPCFGLIGVTLVGVDRVATVVLLVTLLGFNGFVAAGFRASVIDIAPDFSATITGLSSGVGNCVAFISPYIAGALTDHQQTMHQWHIIFWLAAGVFFMGATAFCLFGSSERQPWALQQQKTEESKAKEVT